MIETPMRKPEYLPRVPNRPGINPPSNVFYGQPQQQAQPQPITYGGQGGGGNKIGFLDTFLKAAAGLMRARASAERYKYRQGGGGGNVSSGSTNSSMAQGMAGQPVTFSNRLPEQKAPRVDIGQWGKIGNSPGGTSGGSGKIVDNSTFESRNQGDPNTDYGSLTGAMQTAGLLPAIANQAKAKAIQSSPYQAPLGGYTNPQTSPYPTPGGGTIIPETASQPSGDGMADESMGAVPAMVINPETGLMEPNPEYLKRKKKPIETEGDETGGE
jgi:hypothetical protein